MPETHRRPFSYITTKFRTITSGQTDFMITRAPWPAPANRYYIVRKIDVQSPGNDNVASGNAAVFWDQDLSSATPASRGSGGGPLLVATIHPTIINNVSGAPSATASGAFIGANEATPSGLDTQPRIPFYAGITCRAPINTTIQLELEVV